MEEQPAYCENEFSLPEPFRTKWIKALRSEKHEQGVGYLCQSDYHGRYSYCPLGLACKILGTKNNEMELHARIKDSWFIEKDLPSKLRDREEFAGIVMKMNDDELCTFKEIANWIEKATYPSPSSVGDSNG